MPHSYEECPRCNLLLGKKGASHLCDHSKEIEKLTAKLHRLVRTTDEALVAQTIAITRRDAAVRDRKVAEARAERLRDALEAIEADCPGTNHHGPGPCPHCAPWAYASAVLDVAAEGIDE